MKKEGGVRHWALSYVFKSLLSFRLSLFSLSLSLREDLIAHSRKGGGGGASGRERVSGWSTSVVFR